MHVHMGCWMIDEDATCIIMRAGNAKALRLTLSSSSHDNDARIHTIHTQPGPCIPTGLALLKRGPNRGGGQILLATSDE
jgi:hypothetical protein